VRDCPDGWENTILAVAVDDAYAVPWLAPEDYVFSPETVHDALFGKFQDCCYALFGGGTGVRRIPATISDEHLMALITPDGGERVSALEVTLPPTAEPDEQLIRQLAGEPGRAVHGPATDPELKTARDQSRRSHPIRYIAPGRTAPVVSSTEDLLISTWAASPPPRTQCAADAVPEPVIQQFALRVLREAHEDEYKRAVTVEEKRKVAEKLLALAHSLEADPAGRFVTLQPAARSPSRPAISRWHCPPPMR
jgi:hypothetical protein